MTASVTGGTADCAGCLATDPYCGRGGKAVSAQSTRVAAGYGRTVILATQAGKTYLRTEV
ncbi:MAG: hypothetical protein DDT31_01099 [Syntrophomonadaceae bacterium]|nr:hypothetical protein [Bacillota bacterium]